jgi:hypothetical protein
MKCGRKVEGHRTFLRSMDGPRVREYVDVTAYRVGDEPAMVLVGFETGSDWYQNIQLTPAAARRLRDNLNRAATYATCSDTEEGKDAPEGGAGR